MGASDDHQQLSRTFDGRFDRAPDLIKNQQHHRQGPPQVGVADWQTSAILRPAPDSSLADHVNKLTMEALQYAGPNHWRTGRHGSAHLTVQAVGVRRDDIGPEDPAAQRYAAALRCATAALSPLTFIVRGLILTPGTVMAVATPVDDQPDRLRTGFVAALGADADDHVKARDIWYLNLLHFADDIADSDGLISWVDSRRSLPIGSATIDACDLVSWDAAQVDGRHVMSASILAHCPLGTER